MPIQSQTTPTPSSTIATPIMVECRTESDCGGSSVTSTIKDCCDHNMEPSGFAYTIPGVDGCNLCPVGKIVVYCSGHVYMGIIIKSESY